MNRRFFLKIASVVTATAGAAAKTVIASDKKVEDWQEFADKNPKHSTYFRLKNKETGDFRIGYIQRYRKSKIEFLLRKVKIDDNRSTAIDKRIISGSWVDYEHKEWVWKYTDELLNIPFSEK